MKNRIDKFWRYVFFLLLLPGFSHIGLGAETALDRYVAKPDDNYRYEHYRTETKAGYTVYFLDMVSQKWRSESEVDRPLWEHEVVIVIPQFGLDTTDTAVLLIDGGDNDDEPIEDIDHAFGAAAIATGAVIAAVRQVPNQPLFFTDDPENRRKEDEILAYSLDKALDTGDMEWAVHLAMTKAAVRALDTIQAFVADKGKDIKDFLVIGGSKRGWTAWLTAAVDPRVGAIVPASIDMLNLGKQFTHHWESYGFYAPAVSDYAGFDLPCRVQTAQGRKLLRVVDPYAYRDRYTMPKLILNSTGDQFFTTDSSRFYYDQLPGRKWMRYAPNTDHFQSTEVIVSALSWVNDALDNTDSPNITWSLDGGVLRVLPSSMPKKVRLWQATNPDARDFRLEKIGKAWTSQELQPEADGSYLGVVAQPASGWTAYFIEVTYEIASLLEPDQVYATGVQITPDTLPYSGTACESRLSQSNLESPGQDSIESGIGLIRGWICDAETVEVQIDNGERRKVAYGTTRKDTVKVCGDANNGFGITYNWNSLSSGTHILKAFVDGKEFANVAFNVVTLGQDYLEGVSGEYTLSDFPQPGKNITLRWAERHQNFVIVGTPAALPQTVSPLAAPGRAYLESPQQGSFESGVSLIRGWVCEAEKVEVQIDGGERQIVAYGTTRKDTVKVCGDANNGFGVTYNWNNIGDGTHRLQAYADGVAFADVRFTVTTLGVDYLEGVSGEYTLSDFPQPGKHVTVRWAEPHQNFVISNFQQ